ncbi:MAG: acyltransferase [Chthoniobacteraceae bacterium]
MDSDSQPPDRGTGPRRPASGKPRNRLTPHTANSHRIEALDSARGLAAIAVVCSHLVGAYGLPPGWPNYLSGTLVAVLWDGSAAVSMFFVLSGLVLSRKFFREAKADRETTDSLAPYFVARAFRIVPPYMAAVILSAFLALLLPPKFDVFPIPSAWLQSMWHIAGGVRDLVRQCLFPVSHDSARYLPQAWTLTIELKYSLLVPFLVLIARHSGWWLLIFAVLFMSIASGIGFLIHFTLGILISRWALPARETLRRLPPLAKLALLLTGLYFYAANFTALPWLSPRVGEKLSWMLTGIGSALLLVVLLAWRRLESILNHAYFSFAGRISYSVYLLHFAVLMCITPRALSAVESLGWDGPWISRLSAVGVTFAATLAISAMFYRWIELPSIAMGKWVGALIRRWLVPNPSA